MNDEIHLPLGPCASCMQDLVETEKPEGKSFGGFYCPHHQSGALLMPLIDGSLVWQITTPITEEQFALLGTRVNQRTREMAARMMGDSGSIN